MAKILITTIQVNLVPNPSNANGTQKGSPKANPGIKFGATPMNSEGFMTNYSR